MHKLIYTVLLILFGFNVQAQIGSRVLITDSLLDNWNRYKFVAEDFNADQLDDVFAIKDNTVYLFEQQSDQTFLPPKVVYRANKHGGNSMDLRKIIFGDIDGDGYQDMITAEGEYVFLKRISYYYHRNKQDGTFANRVGLDSRTSVEHESVDLKIVDVDADGDNDFIHADEDGRSGNVVIMYNTGSGNGKTWSKKQISNTLGAKVPEVGDISGDGNPDLVIPFFPDSVGWYENTSGTNFSTKKATRLIAFSILLLDLDSDGDIDIVSEGYGSNVHWVKNDSTRKFDTLFMLTSGGNFQFVDINDVNGDGLEDVIGYKSNKIYWHKNHGNGQVGTKKLIGNYKGSILKVTDVDNDGDLDFYTLDGDDIYIHRNFMESPYQYTGQLFFDENQNKKLDSTEKGFDFLKVTCTPTGAVEYSSDRGYAVTTDKGFHTIGYELIENWGLTTDSTSYTRNVSDSASSITDLNFGFYPDTIITNVEPSLSGSFPRCDRIINYWLNLRNEGTTIPSGLIELTLADSIHFNSSDLAYDSIVGQTIYWHYDSLFYFSNMKIRLTVEMPDFNSIGDTLTSELIVKELDANGNTISQFDDSLSQILRCAYDPNDKLVLPKGNDSANYIVKDQQLEYQVRFQNTGNDTAFHVMVRDQLSDKLDWNTVKPISSSHDMTFKVDENNGEIVVNFNDILLPDSTVNEVESHGYFKFLVNPKHGLLPNTPILNWAEIYFDSNPAIVTNSVLITIECYDTLKPIIVTKSASILSATTSAARTYQWYESDTLIAGANADTIVPSASGAYKVQMIDTNGCSHFSDTYIHFAVGIEEINTIQASIFPNPFSESFKIQLKKPLNSEVLITIQDIAGRQLMSDRIFLIKEVKIDKGIMKKGIYIISLIESATNKKLLQEKIIVE